MRIALACSWCRSSKIKCIHEGQAPCTGCAKRNRQCVLTLPEIAIIADEKKRKRKEENFQRKQQKLQNGKASIEGISAIIEPHLESDHNTPEFRQKISPDHLDNECNSSFTNLSGGALESQSANTASHISPLSQLSPYQNNQHRASESQYQFGSPTPESYPPHHRPPLSLPHHSLSMPSESSCQLSQAIYQLNLPAPPPGVLSRLNNSNCLFLPPKLQTLLSDPTIPRPANSLAFSKSSVGIAMQRPHNQRLESLKGTPLEYISIEIIQECCEILINIFPEMCIVHPALNSFPDMIRKEDKLVLNAIVALCARYISRSAEESRKLSNSCVDFILQQSANQVFLEPSIPLIKALLLVSLSAWGEGKDYLSWMIHGMASRMLQYVHYAQKDNVISSKNRNSVNPASNTSTANLSVPDGDKNAHKNDPAIDPHSENDGVARTLEDELRVRTQWAGSIMDILISSGKDRPRAFQKCYIDSIPLPCNDEDFLFAFMDTTGTIKGPSMYMTDTHRVKNHQFRNYYLHKIFHIWGRTTAWITSGGRHKPGELKPWDKNSNWYTLTKELRDFKRELPMRLKFSKASFHAFKAQNLAVIIGMINLTEFVCSAGLHREYLPFFPFAMSGPQGPNVAPLFTDSPPPDKDFWIKSAQVLFESCRNIAHLINFYKLNKVPIYTPFVGYCAFTSSVMCYYASVFPFMDPAQQFSSLYLQNLSNDMTQYLTETSRYWNIARSWYQAAMRIRKLYYDIAMQKDKVTSLSRQAYIKFEKLIENIEHSNLSNDNDSDKADNSIAGHTRTGSKGSHLSENHANQPYPQQSNKSAHNNNNIRSQSLNIPEIPSVNTTPTLLPLTPEFLRSSSSLNDYRRGSFSDHGYAIISGANNYISDSSVTNQELNQFNQSTGELASHFRSQSEVSNAFEKKVTHSPPIQPLGSACSISLSTGVFGQSNESTVFNELFSDFRSLDDFGIISGTDDSSIQYSLTSMLAAIGAWDSAGNSSSNSDMSSSFIQSGVVETDKSSLDHSSSSDDILVKTTIVEPAI